MNNPLLFHYAISCFIWGGGLGAGVVRFVCGADGTECWVAVAASSIIIVGYHVVERLKKCD